MSAFLTTVIKLSAIAMAHCKLLLETLHMVVKKNKTTQKKRKNAAGS